MAEAVVEAIIDVSPRASIRDITTQATRALRMSVTPPLRGRRTRSFQRQLRAFLRETRCDARDEMCVVAYGGWRPTSRGLVDNTDADDAADDADDDEEGELDHVDFTLDRVFKGESTAMATAHAAALLAQLGAKYNVTIGLSSSSILHLTTGVAFSPDTGGAAPDEGALVSRVAAALHVEASTCIHLQCYSSSDACRPQHGHSRIPVTPTKESSADDRDPSFPLTIALVLLILVPSIAVALCWTALAPRCRKGAADPGVESAGAPADTKIAQVAIAVVSGSV